jgi:hypothetical protein
MLHKTGIPLPSISLSISQKAREILSWTVISVVLLVFGVIFLIRGVFFKPEFKMDTFKFSQGTIDTFTNDELASIVYHSIRGRNYFMLQWFRRDNLLADIQSQFPFVTSVQLQRESSSREEI